MQFSEKQIKDFQTLYKKHCNIDIDEKVAKKQGIRLIKLFKILIRSPANKNDSQE